MDHSLLNILNFRKFETIARFHNPPMMYMLNQRCNGDIHTYKYVGANHAG